MNKRHNSIIPVLPHILQWNLEYNLTCSVAAISGRLNEKLAQAKRGDSNLPAMAGVIGFRALLISLGSVTFCWVG